MSLLNGYSMALYVYMNESFPRRMGRIEEEKSELSSFSMHTSNLFDENEDFAGERVDLATGRPIDNSTEVGTDEQHEMIVDTVEHDHEHEDVLPPLREEEDEAAKWLRENGGL